MTIALIDGDLVAMRCAFSSEDELEAWIPCSRCDSYIEEILAATNATGYEVWLSGKNNFRYQVYPEYKGNRKNQSRPKWEDTCKEYLKTAHNAQVLDEAEADDALGFRAEELNGEDEFAMAAIIVTNDKDLKQIPGMHYDPVKKVLFNVTRTEADRWLYYQLLVGDPVDNLKGVPGIGVKKAEKLLQQAEEDFAIDAESGQVPPCDTLNFYYEEMVKMEYLCEEAFEQAYACTKIWRIRNEWQKSK